MSLESARRVLQIEAEAIRALAERLDRSFLRALDMLEACRGRVVLTGMGKSGFIAKKIAATLASTGTPALFLHPAEGVHGDLGMLVRGDVVVAVSNSGETEEIVVLLPAFKRLGVTDADCLIGIVAHILPHKGYDDLFQALALIREKVPNIRCLIVGEAPRKRYLQRLLHLAERLSVRDRLTLVGMQDDVAPFLHAMDLFVLPSHTEGLPITILEAMAAGRPVVATAVGGIPEVVRDGETGILVPERDPRQLADAVLRLLETPGLAKAMGEAGRKRIEEAFTVEREARQTSLLYRQLLGARSADAIRVRPGGQA